MLLFSLLTMAVHVSYTEIAFSPHISVDSIRFTEDRHQQAFNALLVDSERWYKLFPRSEAVEGVWCVHREDFELWKATLT